MSVACGVVVEGEGRLRACVVLLARVRVNVGEDPIDAPSPGVVRVLARSCRVGELASQEVDFAAERLPMTHQPTLLRQQIHDLHRYTEKLSYDLE